MTDISTRNFDDRVGSVRRFNRLYTRRIGVLEDGFLVSPYSLTHAHSLYDSHRPARSPNTTATDIATELGLDHCYLSRILLDFNKRGLVVKTALPNDRRQSLLSLTAKGRMAFAPLEEHSQEQVGAMLRTLSVADQERVVAAMCTIEASLCEAPAPQSPHLLRGPRAGDMGWIVARHGALYAEEYGWDERLEALIAEIVAAFVRNRDPRRERCWIADQQGENVGSILLVRETDDVARLRLLLVEPKARGLGIGARLVDESLRFAREAHYRKVTLWTHSVLTAARRIYERAGFKLIHQWKHDMFGTELGAETWELELR